MAIVATSAAVRAELRAVLEAAGVRVTGDGDTPEEAQLASPAPDALVVHEPLTARERDVLEWLALGLSNRAIAERLGISEHTVKFHVTSIYGKLGVSSRAEAVRRAARRGLITL
ncbi:MAG: response regulator transcription factor [Vicinamibacterales bacterium]